MHDLLQSIAPFWIWLALACIFLAVEVLIVPSGFFLCLGTATGIVAALVFFFPGISWLWSLTFFAVAMVASSLIWWKLIRDRFGRNKSGEEEGLLNAKTRQLTGYQAVLTEDIKGGRGRLRVNDSAWPVEADADYPAGTRVEVVAVNGITLKVKAVP